MLHGSQTWRVAGASVQGKYHQEKNLPCQDAYRFRVLPGGELLIAAADGAGSAERSQEGAQCAVEESLNSLESRLQEGRPEDHAGWQALMAEAFRRTHEALVQLAATDNVSPRSFATTLTCVVASEDWLVVGQIGDGVVVTQNPDGCLSAMIRPQRGEYANEAYFLTMPEALNFVETRACPQAASSLAVTTDGLLRLGLKLPEYEPYPAFFQPLLAFVAEMEDATVAQEQLAAFLASERVRARTDDDVTLVLAAPSGQFRSDSENSR